MTQKKRKSQHAVPQKVFAILWGEAQHVYIWHTTCKSLREVYRRHCAGYSPYTRDLFAAADTKRPRIYHLSTLEEPKTVVYQHCVAWTAFFTQHGYALIGPQGMKQAAKNLAPKTSKIYSRICEKTMLEVLTAEADVTPNDTMATTEASGARRISFRLDSAEAERVEAAASAQGLTLSAYCSAMTRAGRIVVVDTSPLVQYLDTLIRIEALAQKISAQFASSGVYLPRDLYQLRRAVDGLSAHHEKILEAIMTLNKKECTLL